MNSFLKQSSDRAIYLVAAIVSLILSCWINFHEVVLNPDAICYLQSSMMVGTDGIKAAADLCNQARWPFYSVMIHYVAVATHLSYGASAHLMDAFFSLISVLTFIAIVKKLGGTTRILWLAALVILTAHDFNSIRQYIVRDHGFWTFYLLSVWLLLQYLQQPKLKFALLWSISLIVATIFRIEGGVFLCVVPFVVFFWRDYTVFERIKFFISLNLVAMVAGITALGWLTLHPQHTHHLGRLPELTAQLQHGWQTIADRFYASKVGLVKYVLSQEGERDAGMILAITFFVAYLMNVISSLSLIYTALVAYALKSKATLMMHGKRVLVMYILINLVVTMVFYAQLLFLSKRYLVALSLMLMLFVPFALEKLWTHKKWLYAAFFFMFISALGGIFDFGHSKFFMRNAGDWMAVNVPKSASLYVNDFQTMYYTQHFGNQIFTIIQDYNAPGALTNHNWRKYDYIAIRVGEYGSPEESAFVAESNLTPVQVFKNHHGDRIDIYKVSSEGKQP